MNQVKLSARVRPNSEVTDWVHTEILAMENTIAEQAREISSLRNIISECATACGAAVSVECSLEFMAMLPKEIALKAKTSGVVLPDGWVQLTIEHEPGYPEDVAFGPQRMMDRLKKWLDRYFEMRLNSSTTSAGDERATLSAFTAWGESIGLRPALQTVGELKAFKAGAEWKARAALSAPSHGEQVRVVPVEPTEAMRKAAQDKLASEGLIVTDWLIHTAYSAMLYAAPAADAWIPVSERLPGDQGHDSEEVLCFLNGHCSRLDDECRQGGGWGIRLGYYDADIGTFRVLGRPKSHVTHWMPLPAAPIKIEANRHDQ